MYAYDMEEKEKEGELFDPLILLGSFSRLSGATCRPEAGTSRRLTKTTLIQIIESIIIVSLQIFITKIERKRGEDLGDRWMDVWTDRRIETKR